MNKSCFVFIIGVCFALIISTMGYIIYDQYKTINEDIDYNYYNSRFHYQALSDFWLIQLYMFPFNDNDTVSMYFEGEYDEVIFISHTQPNPDYLPREVYKYRFHFDRELTIEEIL